MKRATKVENGAPLCVSEKLSHCCSHCDQYAHCGHTKEKQMQARPVAIFQSPNIVRDLRALPEFKIAAQQFRDDLGHKMVEHKKKIKTDGNKLCGFIMTPEYKAMLFTFCPDLVQIPAHLGELPMLYGMPIEEGEVSTIAFKFEQDALADH